VDKKYAISKRLRRRTVIKIPHCQLHLTMRSMKTNSVLRALLHMAQGERVVVVYAHALFFTRGAGAYMASMMAMICCATTESTSTSMRLNSSKLTI